MGNAIRRGKGGGKGGKGTDCPNCPVPRHSRWKFPEILGCT